jgi:(3S)-malyl-CoA thioesterase
MEQAARPYRSVLYIPGSKERALEKAKGLPVDAIIFDLEDAVAPDEKINARGLLAQTLEEGGYGPRVKLVRVNGLDTEWGADDISAFAEAPAEALLIPKVGSAADLDAVAEIAPNKALWAMIETPEGILHAEEIAAHPKLQGFVLGTNDLAKDLGTRFRADRLPMMTALQMSLLAARAHGVICIDGVYNAFKDDDGLRAECEQGRDLGMDGKSLIHLAQVAITNEVFAPTEDEIALARRQIEAFEAAKAEGQGVAVVDGKIVENLHVATAQATLAKADAIAELEAAA